MFKQLPRWLFSWAYRASYHNHRVLSVGYGQFKSIKLKECVDSKGMPIPWYTYPAIDYLKQLDFTKKTVFEYGSGNSSKYWAARCSKLVCVEHNKVWFNKIQSSLPENVEYHFCEERDKYPLAIHKSDIKFDVIVIDGIERFACAQEAVKNLKQDGFIILDNSDWHEKTSEFLRAHDLIEIDMSGFGPINNYTWTTSLFLKRGVDLVPLSTRQPLHAIGALKKSEHR